MNVYRFLFVYTLVAVLAAGASCKVKDRTPPSDAAAQGDHAPADDGAIDGDDTPGVVIVSPTAIAYTNATVTIKAAFTGPSRPGSIEFVLFPDGEVIGTATSAPYDFRWDTSQQSEGTYQVAARVAGEAALMSSSVTIVVDRAPPVIQSQTPLSGATNVFLADPVVLTASEPLAPVPQTGNAIQLSAAGTIIPATVTLSPDGTTITLVPSVPAALSLPAQIAATFSNRITDLAGNPLPVPPTTWTWTAPIWADRGSLTGQNPSLALDLQGNPVISATAQQSPGATTYQIAINRFIPGQGWSALDPPTPDGVDAVTSLAIDSTGAAVLAWSKDHVFVARSAGALVSLWDFAYGVVDAIPSQAARSPSLALDATDAPVVAWAYPNGHTDLVYASRWSAATVAWQSLSPAGDANIAAGTPVLRLDSAGAPVLVSFLSSDGLVTRFTAGAWSPVDTSAATSYARDAFVADLRTDPFNRPTIVVPSPSAGRIRVASLVAGTWQDLTTPVITAAGVADARLAFDSGGLPIVLWTESNRNLRVARWTGAQWDYAFGSVLPANGIDSTIAAPALAVDKSRRPIIAWTETSGGQVLTYVRQSNR